MNEYHFGLLDKRELTLRWYAPLTFCDWTPESSFRFSWHRLLNPRRWLDTASSISSWRVECRRYGYMNHRCWCGVGSMIDGCIVVCGFGLQWFLSDFTGGDVPCPCDNVLAAMDAIDAMDVEEEAAPTLTEPQP